ncbi:MAG TPA: hypothetical protein VFG50_05640 [Rhodothermales bacterium]|nr:hypothetical protein [Rhodothermales bacterium]
MFRIGPVLFLLVSVLLICWSGCDTHKMQGEFADQAFSPPKNYTHTDASGEIVKDNNAQPLEDPDDWRVAPSLPAPAIDVDPAYPNPASAQEQIYVRVTIRFDVDLGGALHLAEPIGTRRLNELQAVQVTGIGTYILNFPAGQLGSTGLHRLVVVSGRGEIVTYGDVNVQ